MDDCDSFPHARCLQALRSMAAHLHRQTQSRNAREAGWSGAYKVWIPIISVNNKSNIALATSCILYTLIEVPSDRSLRYTAGGSTSYRRSVNICWD